MFVLKSTYDKEVAYARKLERAYWHEKKEKEKQIDKHKETIKDWNRLVGELKSLGGMKSIRQHLNQTVFTADDVQRLIQLVHPDKHDGKQMAVEMTQKLIALKEKMK